MKGLVDWTLADEQMSFLFIDFTQKVFKKTFEFWKLIDLIFADEPASRSLLVYWFSSGQDVRWIMNQICCVGICKCLMIPWGLNQQRMSEIQYNKWYIVSRTATMFLSKKSCNAVLKALFITTATPPQSMFNCRQWSPRTTRPSQFSQRSCPTRKTEPYTWWASALRTLCKSCPGRSHSW